MSLSEDMPRTQARRPGRRAAGTTIAAIALGLWLSARAGAAAAQSVFPGAQSDEMTKAIARARLRLGFFWERVRANDPAETGYAVKVIAGDQHGTEHIWLSRITLRGGRVLGMIDTSPRIVRSLRQGQIMDIRDDAIVDWMYFENGRIVGNETGRTMLRFLPPAEREKMMQLYK
jgi:uncharacterized protein YegJ (DUF2314 family)